ncbi:hypothetical protein [Hyphomicrobium sp. 2TAF46]|uniref:hypothetical protein n=1 Tax=Hyphomicrobium sp. 2TAF46 TaxID=3233019 RepID=UPI003F93D6B2
MSARIYIVLSAVIAVTIPARAEPLKAPVATHLARDTSHGWKIRAASLTNTAKAGVSPVASATRQLDLSKLTMADFGDVEQSR